MRQSLIRIKSAEPQQVHNIRKVQQQAVQQVHNKSNKWSLDLPRLDLPPYLIPASVGKWYLTIFLARHLVRSHVATLATAEKCVHLFL